MGTNATVPPPAATTERLPVSDAVDIHAHGFPDAYLEKLAQYYPSSVRTEAAPDGSLTLYYSGVGLPPWNRETRLKEMERDGVRLEVLSAPTVYSPLDDHGAELCRLLNDFQHQQAAEAPGRFRSFLHLPVNDLRGTREELERWRGSSDVVGIVLGSNMAGVYPGEQAFLPVWEMIAGSGLPVFIHPVTPPRTGGPVAPPIIAFPADTTASATSIIYGGVFERFPKLRLILSHYGGALPFLARRIDMGTEIPGFPRGQGQGLPHLPHEYVSRFYVDTAQGFHQPAFDCASSVFGMERMLYGSDHFLLGNDWRQKLNTFLEDLHLAQNAFQAITRKNAEGLLRL